MSEPFTFERFLTFPRLSGLGISPDGRRLVVAVGRLHVDGKKMATTLWQVDPEGTEPPRRLTRSAAGESGGTWLPDGSLLFTSERPDPEAKEKHDGDEPIAALWLLPAGGGEARLLIAPTGCVDAVRASRDGSRVVFASALHTGVATLEADTERAKARKEAGLDALLFEDYPIRHWDHYLGPRQRHLLAAALPTHEDEPLGPAGDLLPDHGVRLEEMGFDVTPDGRTAIAAVRDLSDLTAPLADLVAVDIASGERRRLTTGDAWYDEPVCSPDGRYVACTRSLPGEPERAEICRLWLIDLATGSGRQLAASLDAWPHGLAWAADSGAVFFLAEHDGNTLAHRVDLADDAVTRLAASGTYSDLCPSPDGRYLFALRAGNRVPPEVVRLDARAADQVHTVLPSPACTEEQVDAPGKVERLETRAADGTRVASWLLLPRGASAEAPAPLIVFVHGGPLGSWTDGWHWRWNPHLLVERGYAVLLPDPALSLGYGQAYLQRGWGRWGTAIYEDVTTAVDAALQRPDLDRERTALMGGSFGGYMANWVAGHTDRYRAIVTHASLWELRGFHGTTDEGPVWEREMGDPYRDPSRYLEHSPAAHVAAIRTPMLVIHGERDHRVPISEALRLWTDLRRHGVEAKFLYFPDENHWVLKPQNARLWYATVLAFLDHHVLGQPWVRPDLV